MHSLIGWVGDSCECAVRNHRRFLVFVLPRRRPATIPHDGAAIRRTGPPGAVLRRLLDAIAAPDAAIDEVSGTQRGHEWDRRRRRAATAVAHILARTYHRQLLRSYLLSSSSRRRLDVGDEYADDAQPCDRSSGRWPTTHGEHGTALRADVNADVPHSWQHRPECTFVAVEADRRRLFPRNYSLLTPRPNVREILRTTTHFQTTKKGQILTFYQRLEDSLYISIFLYYQVSIFPVNNTIQTKAGRNNIANIGQIGHIPASCIESKVVDHGKVAIGGNITIKQEKGCLFCFVFLMPAVSSLSFFFLFLCISSTRRVLHSPNNINNNNIQL